MVWAVLELEAFFKITSLESGTALLLTFYWHIMNPEHYC